MDKKSLALSALSALVPVWSPAGAMLELLRAADFRPDLCEAVIKLIAQAAQTVKDRTDLARFQQAQSSLATIYEKEAADRAKELGSDSSATE